MVAKLNKSNAYNRYDDIMRELERDDPDLFIQMPMNIKLTWICIDTTGGTTAVAGSRMVQYAKYVSSIQRNLSLRPHEK